MVKSETQAIPDELVGTGAKKPAAAGTGAKKPAAAGAAASAKKGKDVPKELEAPATTDADIPRFSKPTEDKGKEINGTEDSSQKSSALYPCDKEC